METLDDYIDKLEEEKSLLFLKIRDQLSKKKTGKACLFRRYEEVCSLLEPDTLQLWARSRRLYVLDEAIKQAEEDENNDPR